MVDCNPGSQNFPPPIEQKGCFQQTQTPFYAKNDEMHRILSILGDKSNIYWFCMSKLLILCCFFAGHGNKQNFTSLMRMKLKSDSRI